MPSTTARPAVAAALVAAVLALSACGSEDPPKPLGKDTPSSSSSPSESSSPSSSPSASTPAGVPTTAPEAPSAASKDLAGAKAYGGYVTQLIDYVSSARDFAPFQAELLNPGACKTCTQLKAFIADLEKKQQFIVGPAPTITRQEAMAVKGEPGSFQVVTFFDYANKKLIDAQGKQVSYDKGSQKFLCALTVVWSDAKSAFQVRTFDYRSLSKQG